jgi:hypothetical protein
MKDINLKKLVTEVKKAQKKTLNATYKKVMSHLTLEQILKSNFLSEAENTAIRNFFIYRGRGIVLNERTISSVQKEIMNEDFWSSISTATKNALSSGWDSIKKIWGNFKVFVQAFIDQIKKGFDKMLKWILDKVAKSLDWLNKLSTTISTQPEKAKEALKKTASKLHAEKAEDLHASLKSDTQHFTEAGSHLYSYITDNIIGGKLWGDSVLKGESGNKAELNEVFTDTAVIASLYSLNESGLTHPEDLLVKHPMLNKVVKVCLTALKYSFGILNTIILQIVKMASKKFFTIISFMSKKTGGPGIYEFAVLSVFCAELFEIAGHHINEIHSGLESILNSIIGMVKAFFPMAIGHIEIAEALIHIIATFFYFYAVGVSIVNVLIPSLKSALPEVFLKKSTA